MKNNGTEYICTEKDSGMLLKEILHHRLKISSRLMKSLKVQGGIFLNGQRASIQKFPHRKLIAKSKEYCKPTLAA